VSCICCIVWSYTFNILEFFGVPGAGSGSAGDQKNPIYNIIRLQITRTTITITFSPWFVHIFVRMLFIIFFPSARRSFMSPN
jgi:hypothetical protein